MPKITLYHGDCLEEMKKIPDGSADLILTDPPYGTTACQWDQVIPFEPMWEQIKRIRKPRAAVCLFGSEPFSSYLRMSNIKEFKYDWIWEKNKSTGFLNANKQPLKDYEIISVFYSEQCQYNPQKTKADRTYKRGFIKRPKSDCYGEERDFNQIDDGRRYPKRIIYFNNNFTQEQIHPTQKPTKLLEYFISTYTKEGETVVDFTMGSGQTGIACLNTGRSFIGIEWSPVEPHDKYFKIASDRIRQREKEIEIEAKESLFNLKENI